MMKIQTLIAAQLPSPVLSANIRRPGKNNDTFLSLKNSEHYLLNEWLNVFLPDKPVDK